MKVIFFCGDKSRYGMAHLKPLLESRFTVSKVIIPAQERWRIFQRQLLGERYYSEKNAVRWNLKSLIKAIFPQKILNIIRSIVPNNNGLKGENAKNICRQSNVPMEVVFDVNDDKFCNDLKKEGCDLIISAAYPQIFKENLLNIPSKGAVNFHPSALPRCRGAHPHYWALATGEQYGGITAHFMTERLDAGNIIAQITFDISSYSYTEYYDRIIEETPKLVNKVEDYFFNNETKSIPQNSEDSTFFREDREIHHRIFWNLHDSKKIYNLVRAGNAFFFLRGHKIIISKAYISSSNRNITNNVIVESGTVVDFLQDSVVIQTLSGFINIQEVNINGKKLSWRRWSDEYKIRIGLKME